MSTNCPYDDTWCVHKAQELSEFRARVRRMAKDGVNQVFFEPADDTCPADKANCVRYQRYLNIVEKIKSNEQQH